MNQTVCVFSNPDGLQPSVGIFFKSAENILPRTKPIFLDELNPLHFYRKLTHLSETKKKNPFLHEIELISARNSMNEEEITHKPENSRGN
jgi:hypothetical protein